MDDLLNGTRGQNAALLVLAFLEAGGGGRSAYGEELLSLRNELNLPRDINGNARSIGPLDDGDLEVDGHKPISTRSYLDDIEPLPDFPWPRNPEEEAALREVVEGLREIGAILERDVAPVAEATMNLLRLNGSFSIPEWKTHLLSEVERLIRQGVGLEHLPQERVFVALTLTLVKGMCEQAPQLLRSLFDATLQYLNPERPR